MRKQFHGKITLVLSTLLIATLACGGQASPGGSDGGINVTSTSSDSQGRATFDDPYLRRQLAVQLSDSSSGEPLQGLSVAFISNGSRLLVLVSDPDKRYPPYAQELDYSSIGLQHRSPGLASPSNQSEIVVAIFMMKALGYIQTGQDWVDAMRENPPHLEQWGFLSQDYCVTGDQMATGLSRALGTLLQLLPGPSEIMEGIPALGNFQDWGWLAALADMSGMVSEDYLQADLYDRLAERGAIIRWRVFSIDGIPFGVPAIPVGWCLEPLDRSSTSSVAGWLQYGFLQSEMYVFEKMIPDEELQAGIPATEAGGAISGVELLENFRQSLPNGVACRFISIDPSYSSVTVATSGWNPPFLVPTIINLFTGEVSATQVESEYVTINATEGYIRFIGIGVYPDGTDPLEIFQLGMGASQPCQ